MDNFNKITVWAILQMSIDNDLICLSSIVKALKGNFVKNLLSKLTAKSAESRLRLTMSESCARLAFSSTSFAFQAYTRLSLENQTKSSFQEITIWIP